LDPATEKEDLGGQIRPEPSRARQGRYGTTKDSLHARLEVILDENLERVPPAEQHLDMARRAYGFSASGCPLVRPRDSYCSTVLPGPALPSRLHVPLDPLTPLSRELSRESGRALVAPTQIAEESQLTVLCTFRGVPLGFHGRKVNHDGHGRHRCRAPIRGVNYGLAPRGYPDAWLHRCMANPMSEADPDRRVGDDKRRDRLFVTALAMTAAGRPSQRTFTSARRHLPRRARLAFQAGPDGMVIEQPLQAVVLRSEDDILGLGRGGDVGLIDERVLHGTSFSPSGDADIR
jgi:hypothetical protein